MDIKNLKLVYNAAAHFAAAEKYPDGLMEELRKPGAASFDAMCWTLAEMAKQAELVRRLMGEKPEEPPKEIDFKLRLGAGQIKQASDMMFATIIRGLRGDAQDEDEEIDEVLIELQKKRKND